jgi:hypothetical protein
MPLAQAGEGLPSPFLPLAPADYAAGKTGAGHCISKDCHGALDLLVRLMTTEPTTHILLADTLAEMRAALPPGWHYSDRTPVSRKFGSALIVMMGHAEDRLRCSRLITAAAIRRAFNESGERAAVAGPRWWSLKVHLSRGSAPWSTVNRSAASSTSRTV